MLIPKKWVKRILFKFYWILKIIGCVKIMLRFETEFIVSDLIFSKWDDKGLIGLASDTYETK